MFTRVKYFVASMLFFINAGFSQYTDQGVELVHYVFREFSPGTVKMKSGEIVNQSLNYNILTGEMIFNDGVKYLAIASLENVDTVYINDRIFIPLNNKFFEVLVNSNTPLLLEFTSTIKEPGASTGYGGTSTTTAATPYKSLISSGGAYQLKLPDGFTVKPGFIYWIRKNNKLEKVSNIKQLIKIFPDKKDIINDYVEKNGTNFSKREDLIMLVRQIE